MLKIVNEHNADGKTLTVGDEISLNAVVKILTAFGFKRVDRVDKVGEFSVRGDTLDVCAVETYRIMFYGDEIEAIKEINLNNYNTISNLKTVTLLPQYKHARRTIIVCNAEVPVEIFVNPLVDGVFLPNPKRAKKLHLKPSSPYENTLSRFDGNAKIGSYVLHEKHGLGKFVGVKTMEIGGHSKRYIMLQYGARTIVYVPLDQACNLQIYHGSHRRLDRI